ncbi:MAG TPA: amidohydrolase family protein, partial [Syntrophales bacterium]|nr:amidohydrolase family protein [Syntrophales bacterium]
MTKEVFPTFYELIKKRPFEKVKRFVNASDFKNRVEELRLRVRAARGEVVPDLVLKGGRVVDVFAGEILDADVAVLGGHIVGVGNDYSGPCVIDCRGKFITPGFIDGHIHIESTLLSPRELATALVPHGTTAVVCDPHEIANVLGAGGVEYILDEGAGLPLDVFVMLPSCVPATHLETAGAELSTEELLKLAGRERVLGLAEMMNYPGVLSGREEVLEKIAAFCELPKDGHAPLLSGKDLNAYIGAGIHSDHECTRESEAREKLRLGMHVMIREGTQAKNLRALLPVVTPRTVARCSLITDDLHPHDILERGHLNYLMERAVEEGLDPVLAVTMTTLSP